MKIETQALDERTGTSGLSTRCMLTKSYALFRRRIMTWQETGSAIGPTGDDAVNIVAILVPILPNETRADEGNRTPNLLITNQLLCQLSYVSQCAEKDKLLVWRASASLTFQPVPASMLEPLINSAGFCAPRSHASMKGACM